MTDVWGLYPGGLTRTVWLEKKKYNGGSAAGESYLTLMNRGHVYDLGGWGWGALFAWATNDQY